MRLFPLKNLCWTVAFAATSSHAFSFTPSPTATVAASRRVWLKPTLAFRPLLASSSSQNDHDNNDNKSIGGGVSLAKTTTATATSTTALLTSLFWMATSQMATAAVEPDWGIFEGRTGSLLHPITMGGLFLYASYTAYLGFQYRRQRTIGDEISAIKKTIPVAKMDENGNELPPSAAVVQAQEQIAALTAERKEISTKAPRDQHFSQGALLAFLGTAFAIEGPLNTYARAGKLFPGPHLYAGAGLVVLWALAVATIPSMIKGNDTARTIHIGANLTGLAMFAWQVTTGIPILLKVIEKTSWP